MLLFEFHMKDMTFISFAMAANANAKLPNAWNFRGKITHAEILNSNRYDDAAS